jgi:hypothetical protein
MEFVRTPDARFADVGEVLARVVARIATRGS